MVLPTSGLEGGLALGLLVGPGPEAGERAQAAARLLAQGGGLGLRRPGVQGRQDVLLAQHLDRGSALVSAMSTMSSTHLLGSLLEHVYPELVGGLAGLRGDRHVPGQG